MRMAQSILQRVGIRQLPRICWYPAKCTEESVNQGGTADNVYSPLTDFILSRVFVVLMRQATSSGIGSIDVQKHRKEGYRL